VRGRQVTPNEKEKEEKARETSSPSASSAFNKITEKGSERKERKCQVRRWIELPRPPQKTPPPPPPRSGTEGDCQQNGVVQVVF